MRYQPATCHELNQLAENHQTNQQPSPELDLPVASFAQVLLWLDDMCPSNYPSNEQIQAARELPPTTTLAETLKFLGADLSAYGR